MPLRIIQRWRRRDDDVVLDVHYRRVLERTDVRDVPRRRCWGRRRDYVRDNLVQHG